MDSSIESGSYAEQTMESHVKQSFDTKKQRYSKYDEEGQDDSGSQDPMDKREKNGRSKGSRNFRKEGGARDQNDYDGVDPRKRDYCFCYEHITRNTADCLCNSCLGRSDNDLEEMEKQVYKRQQERKTRAGTKDENEDIFDFDYFGDKGTTDYNYEKEYYLQQQHKRSKGTIQPRLEDRNDYFIVQEPSKD